MSRLGVPILLSVIFLLAAPAGQIDAQDTSRGAGTAQPATQGQTTNPMPCYLGAYGQAPGESADSFGYPGQSAANSGMTGANGDSSQQGYSSGRGYASQGDANAAREYSSQDQGYTAEPSNQDYNSSYDQGQQDYGTSYDQRQQEGQYLTNQSQFGSMPNQSTFLVNQIIQILQGSPDLLSSFKDLAAQQYGVDSATIPDSGVYNCIQRDSGFRSQVAAQLVQQGYTLSPLQGQPGANRGTNRANEGNPQYLPYSPDLPPSRYPESGPAPPRSSEQPGELRRLTPVPYSNLPSLRDLYSQEVPDGSRLRRFGSDAFELGSGNANLLPMDLPVGPDYVLGPGDNLIVNMWGGQSARLNRTVDRQGEIALPEAGTVAVSGITITQAQDAIQKALGTQFQDEHVELSLGRVRTIRIYVVGDVQRPGAYDVSSLSTVVNALYAARGPTNHGSLRILKQYRANQLVQEIDLYDFLLHGVRSDMQRLIAGDTILVPPVGPQVSVSGMVRRPAIYELKGKEDLKDVLSMAGGVLVSADLKEIRVERVEAHEDHTMLRVQIPDGALDTDQLTSFMVQDGDNIQVSPILPYNEKVVYLEGHVFKPGQYAWREGMTVSDLVHSYQDIMPEPADHAEVVRLVPPDLHPETISFSLPDELVGNGPVPLQPFDTVRVFGRYQIDSPKVSIFGPVLRPGTYPMPQGMTVTDLVRMAGGFRRSAYHEEADLSSYKVENGQKVLIGYSVVDIGKALDGDKGADVPLEPGDVVGIRQLTGWNDIGSSITINGEVAFAGTYGIELGERLSSVLKRAGGFNADAYPEGAILDRVQVRELEENNRQEMIRRVESSIPNASQGVNGTSQDQLNTLQAMRQQQQDVLAALRGHPPSGRMIIKISSDIGSWENTPADIVVRAGDHLTIPKRPDFVLVSGQVYNATGITYRPGKEAGWYLHQAGGATRSGDKRAIFILRADGSVVGDGSGTIFDGGVLSTKMHPGDSVIVPEKIVGGSQLWRNIIGTAQIASSVALTGAVAGVF
jgi:protein involved in polysaccharide export with SLBB domain